MAEEKSKDAARSGVELQHRMRGRALLGRLSPERVRRDPKDGELRLGRPKPGETPVEGRNDSDVQIGRMTWV